MGRNICMVTYVKMCNCETVSSQQCEASLLANMSSDCGAVCVGTATLLHMHVCVGDLVSIQTEQVNSAIAEVCLLTAGAGTLHGCCCFRVPAESRGWDYQYTLTVT